MDAPNPPRRPSFKLSVILAPLVADRLADRARSDGRTLSNLAAYLIESGLNHGNL